MAVLCSTANKSYVKELPDQPYEPGLSKTLQHATFSATEGKHLAKLTLDVLTSIWQPQHFQTFYQRVLLQQQQLDISSHCLLRKCTSSFGSEFI